MAHYAQIDETNTVTNVIVVNNETIYNLPYPESEPVGQAFIATLGFQGVWLETSYNANFRGIYAGIGFTYDPALDIFVQPIEPEPIEPTA
jgi:hypothetical protein